MTRPWLMSSAAFKASAGSVGLKSRLTKLVGDSRLSSFSLRSTNRDSLIPVFSENE